MNTEAIDKLYLELSQFTQATTAKELQLLRVIDGLSSNLEPVKGDLLPPVGAPCLINLASCDAWVPHTVVGYYVWGRKDGGYRVFVRVVDTAGILNARLLEDVRWGDQLHGIEG